jgi:7-carboxy-7-deazaguanine synthase
MNEAPARRMPTLRISEIFHSIQGESSTMGRPTVFVRLTGCPLRCHYCDTAYAFTGGDSRSLESVLGAVAAYGTPHVCVTGGEPLAQPACRALLTALADAGHAVSLETSGALDIGGLDPRVVVVMDLKTPSSGEAARNRLGNLAHIRARDEIKFVIGDRADYDWAGAMVREHELARRCNVLFSPAWGRLEPRVLAEWILADRLPVCFQVQLHKYLWGEARGY